MDLIAMKQSLNEKQLLMLHNELENRKKSPVVMWLLWLFLGGLGGHRYYLGYIGRGIAMTLTLGGLGIWTLIDAFFIMGALRKVNEKIELDIIQRIQSVT